MGVIKIRSGLFIIIALSVLLCASSSADNKFRIEDLSRIQVDKMAQQICKYTPENTRSASGTKFFWVLLDGSAEKSSKKVYRAVKSLLEQKYKVYEKEEEIPENLVLRDATGKLVGYEEGFRFGYSITPVDSAIIEVQSFDWEGNESSMGRTDKYQWDGSDWIIVEKGVELMS